MKKKTDSTTSQSPNNNSGHALAELLLREAKTELITANIKKLLLRHIQKIIALLALMILASLSFWGYGYWQQRSVKSAAISFYQLDRNLEKNKTNLDAAKTFAEQQKNTFGFLMALRLYQINPNNLELLNGQKPLQPFKPIYALLTKNEKKLKSLANSGSSYYELANMVLADQLWQNDKPAALKQLNAINSPELLLIAWQITMSQMGVFSKN